MKKIRQTAQKVVITEWDEASRLYPLVNRELMSKVQIKETSGRAYNKTVRIPKGDPRNPMSAQAIFRKFDTLVTPVLGTKKSKKLYKIIMEELESLKSVKEISDLMAA